MNDGHVHAVVATRRERDHITGPEEKRSNTSMDTRREKREVPHTPHESDLYGGEIVNSNEEALHTMIHPFEDHTQIVLSLTVEPASASSGRGDRASHAGQVVPIPLNPSSIHSKFPLYPKEEKDPFNTYPTERPYPCTIQYGKVRYGANTVRHTAY